MFLATSIFFYIRTDRNIYIIIRMLNNLNFVLLAEYSKFKKIWKNKYFTRLSCLKNYLCYFGMCERQISNDYLTVISAMQRSTYTVDVVQWQSSTIGLSEQLFVLFENEILLSILLYLYISVSFFPMQLQYRSNNKCRLHKTNTSVRRLYTLVLSGFRIRIESEE